MDKILSNLATYLDNFVSVDIGNSLRSKVLQIIYSQLIAVADTEAERILIL